MRTGFVYEIKSKDTSITGTYIGSTWDMKKRLKHHKHNCNNENSKEYNKQVYHYIRENGDWANFQMTVIDNGECVDRKELECGEQFYIDLAGGIENLLNDRDAIVDKQKRKEKQYIYCVKIHQRHIDNKDFYCDACDHAAQSQHKLDSHLNGPRCKKKKSSAEKNPKNPKIIPEII